MLQMSITMVCSFCSVFLNSAYSRSMQPATELERPSHFSSVRSNASSSSYNPIRQVTMPPSTHLTWPSRYAPERVPGLARYNVRAAPRWSSGLPSSVPVPGEGGTRSRSGTASAYYHHHTPGATPSRVPLARVFAADPPSLSPTISEPQLELSIGRTVWTVVLHVPILPRGPQHDCQNDQENRVVSGHQEIPPSL